MGLYTRHVFPRLCDWAMRTPCIAQLRLSELLGIFKEVLKSEFSMRVTDDGGATL
jgi:hypothetical protein